MNYLYNRKHCVKIRSELSQFKTIEICVSQDSIYESLLFLVYVNDLPGASSEHHSVLFAVDNCLTLSDTNCGRLIKKIIDELIKFDN